MTTTPAWFPKEQRTGFSQTVTHQVINLVQQGLTSVNRQEPAQATVSIAYTWLSFIAHSPQSSLKKIKMKLIAKFERAYLDLNFKKAHSILRYGLMLLRFACNMQ